MHLQTTVTKRGKPLHSLLQGSTVFAFKDLQRAAEAATLHTIFNIAHIYSILQAQPPLCSMIRYSYCWIVLSTARALLRIGLPCYHRKRERKNTHRQTYTHSEPVCLHLVFIQSPGSSWPEYLSAFNELKSLGCENLVIKCNKANIPGWVKSQRRIVLWESKEMEESRETNVLGSVQPPRPPHGE